MQLQDNRFARFPRSRTKAGQDLSIDCFRAPQIRLIRLGEKNDQGSIIAPERKIIPRRARAPKPDEGRIYAADTLQIIALHLALRQIRRKLRNFERHAEIERSMMAGDRGDLPARGKNQRNPRVRIRVVRTETTDY